MAPSIGSVLADVEDLAASFRGSVGVIARDCLGVAGESSVRDGCQDRVVFSRDASSGDGLSEGSDLRVYSVSVGRGTIAVAWRSIPISGSSIGSSASVTI